MKRSEFTKKLADLIHHAIDYLGYEVIIDYVLRDTETQKRLYAEGKSKCDGVTKRSQHQSALAADLYIIEDGKLSNDIEKYKRLHEYWSNIGGEPIITWDLAHFEVKKN